MCDDKRLRASFSIPQPNTFYTLNFDASLFFAFRFSFTCFSHAISILIILLIDIHSFNAFHKLTNEIWTLSIRKLIDMGFWMQLFQSMWRSDYSYKIDSISNKIEWKYRCNVIVSMTFHKLHAKESMHIFTKKKKKKMVMWKKRVDKLTDAPMTSTKYYSRLRKREWEMLTTML